MKCPDCNGRMMAFSYAQLRVQATAGELPLFDMKSTYSVSHDSAYCPACLSLTFTLEIGGETRVFIHESDNDRASRRATESKEHKQDG